MNIILGVRGGVMLYVILAVFGTRSVGGGSAAPETPADRTGIELSKFSFTCPWSGDVGFESWDMSMASVALDSHLILTPAVAGRSGWLFSHNALLTDSFEVYLSFKVLGPDGSTNSPGFALWYLRDKPESGIDVLKVSQSDMLPFMGYRDTFNGLGVFFKPHAKSGGFDPSVSAILASGNEKFDTRSSLPSSKGVYINYRNSPDYITFKLSITKEGSVKGELKLSEESAYMTCFTFVQQEMGYSGYLGLTAGTSAPVKYEDREARKKLLPDLLETMQYPPNYADEDAVFIQHLQTYNTNFDMAGQNDHIGPLFGEKRDRHDFLHDHLHPGRLADEIHSMNRMLMKHINVQRAKTEEMMSTMVHLLSDVRKIKEELNLSKNMGHESVRSEIGSLKQLLHVQNQHQTRGFQALKTHFEGAASPMSKIDTFTKKASSLEQILSSHSAYHLIIGLLVIFSMSAIGLFVWKGFRDMEKRHIL